MKKFLAITLAVVMMMAMMSVSVFAANETTGKVNDNNRTQDIDVKAQYVNNIIYSGDTLSVDISWEAMEFTYTVSGEQSWNSDAHEYQGKIDSTWAAEGNTVTVVNHSNVAVKATFDFAPAEGFGNIEGKFDNETVTLESAAGVGTDAASLKTLTGTTTLTLSGVLKNGTAKGTKVGTVTVTIVKDGSN